MEGYIEEAKSLVAALLEANALELLVQRLSSLDEKVRVAGGTTRVAAMQLGVCDWSMGERSRALSAC